jgi:hypothetical protein
MPQSRVLHHNELIGEDLFGWLFLLLGLGGVDEEAHDIEQSREPGNHKNDMKRFYVGRIHDN